MYSLFISISKHRVLLSENRAWKCKTIVETKKISTKMVDSVLLLWVKRKQYMASGPNHFARTCSDEMQFTARICQELLKWSKRSRIFGNWPRVSELLSTKQYKCKHWILNASNMASWKCYTGQVMSQRWSHIFVNLSGLKNIFFIWKGLQNN